MHDLRHSYASVAANLGESLPMIGKLLGHTQAQATARYAHLAADPVKEATERIARSISEAMGGVARRPDLVSLLLPSRNEIRKGPSAAGRRATRTG